MKELAKRTQVIGKSKIEESLKLVEKRKDVISLGAGEPDFPAPPNVIKAANKFLSKGFTHYSPLDGKIELREAISKKLRKENKIPAEPENIIVTNGSKEAILLSFLALIDPGDEVLIPDPGYLAYRPAAQMIGGKAISIPLFEEQNFETDVEKLEPLITDKTKLIVINNPSNPTGTVFKKKTLEELADFVVEKDLYVLVDEAYEKLVYEGNHISFASLNGMFDRVITTQSFSKTYAMCGFRIGYAVADEKIIKEMKEFKLTTTISAPSAYQMAAVEALKNSGKYVEYMKREYKKRRDLTYNLLKEIDGISLIKPEGAFYAFPNIKSFGIKSEEFSDYVLKKAKVVVVPGTEFGVFGEGYIRISYATDESKIKLAIARIKKAVEELRIK